MTAQGSSLLDAVEELQAQAAGLCRAATIAECRSDCCRAMQGARGRVVGVTLPDVIALVCYLRRPQTVTDLKAETARFLCHYCTVSPLTGTYMLTGEHDNCPFLQDDRSCAVYAVRPALCRLFFHCDWISERPHSNAELDDAAVGTVLNLAQSLARHWPGQAGLLWRQPWRYDAIPLDRPGPNRGEYADQQVLP